MNKNSSTFLFCCVLSNVGFGTQSSQSMLLNRPFSAMQSAVVQISRKLPEIQRNTPYPCSIIMKILFKKTRRSVLLNEEFFNLLRAEVKDIWQQAKGVISFQYCSFEHFREVFRRTYKINLSQEDVSWDLLNNLAVCITNCMNFGKSVGGEVKQVFFEFVMKNILTLLFSGRLNKRSLYNLCQNTKEIQNYVNSKNMLTRHVVGLTDRYFNFKDFSSYQNHLKESIDTTFLSLNLITQIAREIVWNTHVSEDGFVSLFLNRWAGFLNGSWNNQQAKEAIRDLVSFKEGAFEDVFMHLEYIKTILFIFNLHLDYFDKYFIANSLLKLIRFINQPLNIQQAFSIINAHLPQTKKQMFRPICARLNELLSIVTQICKITGFNDSAIILQKLSEFMYTPWDNQKAEDKIFPLLTDKQQNSFSLNFTLKTQHLSEPLIIKRGLTNLAKAAGSLGGAVLMSCLPGWLLVSGIAVGGKTAAALYQEKHGQSIFTTVVQGAGKMAKNALTGAMNWGVNGLKQGIVNLYQ